MSAELAQGRSAGELTMPWGNSRNANRMRPIDYAPNGSFKALKETGKLVENDGGLYDEYKGREQREIPSGKQHIPGYTGYVRSAQHISGRTYGNTTRMALNRDYRDVVCRSSIPSDPESNRKIPQARLEDTFVGNTFADKHYHIPGYTGHVPGVRSSFGKTYGTTTDHEINSHHFLESRTTMSESNGFANTSFPKRPVTIDSAPLPGAAKTQDHPDMFIPAHLKYLKFFTM